MGIDVRFIASQDGTSTAPGRASVMHIQRFRCSEGKAFAAFQLLYSELRGALGLEARAIADALFQATIWDERPPVATPIPFRSIAPTEARALHTAAVYLGHRHRNALVQAAQACFANTSAISFFRDAEEVIAFTDGLIDLLRRASHADAALIIDFPAGALDWVVPD